MDMFSEGSVRTQASPDGRKWIWKSYQYDLSGKRRLPSIFDWS